jgi:hypothetical protein
VNKRVDRSIQSNEEHRAKNAVVVCLHDLGDGHSRIIFDDVVADDPSAEARVWRHRVFFTHNAHDNDQLDEQYQEIGVAVVARLLAINGRIK